MRNPASLLVLIILMLGSTGLCNNNADLVYVRRAYLNELGIPPSVSEIEWLLEYKSNNVKETGIDYVLDYKYGKYFTIPKSNLRKFYLENQHKVPLTSFQQETILKYQAGNYSLTVEQAKDLLVKCALSVAENQEDPIDYLFLCLCGRYTNTEESNLYNKIWKAPDKAEDKNMKDVLNLILKSNNFLLY